MVEVQSAELCKLHTFHDVSSDAGLLMAAAVWQMVASRSVDIYNIFSCLNKSAEAPVAEVTIITGTCPQHVTQSAVCSDNAALVPSPLIQTIDHCSVLLVSDAAAVPHPRH